MPAPVPPGFTRGPILLIGHAQTAPAEATLLQRFWNEAGSYGARILIVPTVSDETTVAHFTKVLKSWEVDAIDVLPVYTRADAQQIMHLALIDYATAILILDGDPLKLARTLGGTPVAQAIRRANARSKVACGVGNAANFLCQHMLLFTDQPVVQFAPVQPMLQFAPGLGAINRLAIDVQSAEQAPTTNRSHRLLSAVAYNPFLVGVGLSVDTGVVIYPDTTLEVFGSQHISLVDGAGMVEAEASDPQDETTLQATGVQIHSLPPGATFNFDQRTVQPPPLTDIPTMAVPIQSKSPF